MIAIQAIETEYGGCRFRSRTEARWAVFFDNLGLRWQYEKEGFKFNTGRSPIGSCYLPDFWLPDVGMWAEVKGDSFTEAEEILCSDLADATGSKVLMLDGLPDYKAYSYFEPRQEFDDYWYLGNCYLTTDYLDEARFFSNVGEDDEGQKAVLRGDHCYVKAVNTARGARFEHGERG